MVEARPLHPLEKWWVALGVACFAWLLMVRPLWAQAQPQALQTANQEDEIVYIDNEGFIRVFDPQTPPQMPAVTFRSPDGGWFDAIVADVNGDGDDEIIAISEEGVLKIYDPVVAAGPVQPDRQFNGVYWDELFVAQLPGRPLLLATGEFDDNPASHEIVVVFEDPDRSSTSRIQILAQPAPPFDGRIWQPLTDATLRAVATAVATGDLDGDGRDEIAVVARDAGRLSVFRREANNVLREFWTSASQQRPWRDVAIGNVAPESSLPELVAVRNAAPPLASLVVLRYKAPDAFEDVFLSPHLPAPRAVFLANVNQASASQIFMFRDVPANDTRPRLFNSRSGTGAGFSFEVRLDADNGYRVATAGDLDGDGKDEIALARDTGLLIFREPASSTTLTQTVTALTNRRTLAIGNLDALGRDFLASAPASLTFSVRAGERAQAQSVTLSNLTRSGSIPFVVEILPRVGFVNATPAAGATPANLSVAVDATDLLPISELSAAEAATLGVDLSVVTPTYGANVVVTAADPLALNSPLTIPVLIEVTPGIVMRPAQIGVMLRSTGSAPTCEGAFPLTMEVSVLGASGITFTVNLTAVGGSSVQEAEPTEGLPEGMTVVWPSSVPWLSATSVGNSVPEILTLTIGAGETPPTPMAEAEIVLRSATPSLVRRVPIRVGCFRHLLYAPLLER